MMDDAIRGSRTLRCTSLHQSTVPLSPSTSLSSSVIDDADLEDDLNEEKQDGGNEYGLRRPSRAKQDYATSPDTPSEFIARARKVTYRRDLMTPKTKSFKRVQDSLREDSTPIEAEIKKEATLARILKEKSDEGPILQPAIQFDNPFEEVVEEQGTSAGRAKRVREEVRYEPYSAKRRAVSPSPASPLGSPSVAKTSIWRISDLNI